MLGNEVPNRIRLVSDGTPWGTKVIDLKTGEPIPRIQSLNLHVTATEKMVATIKMIVDEADVVTDEVEIEYTPRDD